MNPITHEVCDTLVFGRPSISISQAVDLAHAMALAPKQAAFRAAERISVRLQEQTPTCVVCLHACHGSKACACSHMHAECAKEYVARISKTCKICESPIEVSAKMSKRPHDDDEEEEHRARKRQREKQEAEKVENQKWAQEVAPAVAHIMCRHYRFSNANERQREAELCFGSVILSLIHSEEAYVDDLRERLVLMLPVPDVDKHINRLHKIGDSLTSPDGVDEACAEEFMRHFHMALARRQVCDLRWAFE